MPSLLPKGKPEGSGSGVASGFAVANYSFTLGALALKPSSFCNTGAIPMLHKKDGKKW